MQDPSDQAALGEQDNYIYLMDSAIIFLLHDPGSSSVQPFTGIEPDIKRKASKPERKTDDPIHISQEVNQFLHVSESFHEVGA